MSAERTTQTTVASYHYDDYPETLALLNRITHGDAVAGFERTEWGARIDWERLDDSWLSSAEKAAVHIAHGISILERHGGAGPLGSAIRRSIEQVT